MPPSKNVSLLRTFISQADSLATAMSKNEFPVLLRPIAERRKVTSVDFRPLLVDAMLTTHAEGFRILLNSGGEQAEELNEQYRNEAKGKVLHPRLRFSLAHELAHTFFYDLSASRPELSKRMSPGGGRTELENLERHCNQIASHLLLPSSMFRGELLRLKEITPKTIIQFAQKAGVSLHALLLRLDKNDTFFVHRDFRGVVVWVEQHEGYTRIRAVAKPRSLNIARDLLALRSGDVFKVKTCDGDEIDLFSFPSPSFVQMETATNLSIGRKRYRICVDGIRNSERVKSCLATFEEI